MTHVTSIEQPVGGSPQRNRDDFPAPIKEMLAKRVGYICSNPDCRKSTSGPQENPTKAINIGVASHISAASPGGPRYDPALAPEERSAIANGIWLCQNCAKLIDSDPVLFSSDVLMDWREDSESRALAALRRPATTPPDPKFVKLERLMPELLAEMRKDFAEHPLCREVVLLQKNWTFWYPDRAMFTYYTDDHTDLASKFAVLQNYGLVWTISNNNVPRFSISEELAEYCQS
jgi:hypothetical protein